MIESRVVGRLQIGRASCRERAKLFGGGQKADYGGIQGDVLGTDNNTVGMGDAGIKSAIQGSNVPNPDEAVSSFFFFELKTAYEVGLGIPAEPLFRSKN